MKDPFRDVFGAPSAVEDFMRRQRMMDELLKPSATSRMLETIERATAGSRVLDELARRSKLLEFTQTPAYLKAIEAATVTSRLAEVAHAAKFAELVAPKLPDILKLSEIAAARVRPFEALLQTANWDSVLSDRMAGIDVAWALGEDLEGSAEAFARLSRLSDVARAGPTYTDETTEILVDELGQPSEAPAAEETIELREERYDEAGRERELIAFPPTSYGQILVSAGYAIAFPPPPDGVIEEGLVEPVRFSPQTGYLLQSLEAHLRALVANRLHALEGGAWIKRRVSFELRNRWKEGWEAAKVAGKPVFGLIHYSNFMDLGEIITAGNNWPAFAAAFTNKDNLLVSLRRLYYIRNDIAHSRPISMTDELLAMTEGTILFRAMGLPVQYGPSQE